MTGFYVRIGKENRDIAELNKEDLEKFLEKKDKKWVAELVWKLLQTIKILDALAEMEGYSLNAIRWNGEGIEEINSEV